MQPAWFRRARRLCLVSGSGRVSYKVKPMKPDEKTSLPPDRAAPGDESPGVPGFRTWRGVYWFVFAGFGVVVVVLTIFSGYFA